MSCNKRFSTHQRLGKYPQRLVQVVAWVVEPQAPIQRTDRRDFLWSKIEVRYIQILRQASWIVRLRDDSDASLRRPTQQDL